MFPARTILINAYLACFDLAVTAACYLALLWFEIQEAHGTGILKGGLSADHLLALGLLLVLWLALLVSFGMYRSRRLQSPLSDLRVLITVIPVGFLVLEGLARWVPAVEPSPRFLVGFAIVNFVALGLARVAVRLFLHELRRRGHNLKTLLVVASPWLGERLISILSHPSHYGYRLLPPIQYAPDRGNDLESAWREFANHLNSTPLDDVIVALPAEANDLVARVVNECERHGINVRLVPDLLPILQYGTQTYDLAGIPLINVRLYPAEFFGYVVLKRLFDIVVSVAVLLGFSPLYALIALLIKLTSPGPVLFTQERMGMNGRKFRILKFRTMRSSRALDADTHWTAPDDPYVTRLGRWLRRSNLDELPQFWNVLKGEMSIVGPRPERPYFIDRFRNTFPDYMLRHYVKSGITGWAQVNGWRGDTSIEDRLAHDLYYLKNWALTLDLKIVFLTLSRAFFHRNAY